MALLVTVMRVASALNLLLLAGLAYVWGRNWWEMRSKHSLGLVLFAVFLLGENALALYYFAVHAGLSSWIADAEYVPPLALTAMVSLRVLELAGLVFLSWVTWD